jgi:hypothetical protein
MLICIIAIIFNVFITDRDHTPNSQLSWLSLEAPGHPVGEVCCWFSRRQIDTPGCRYRRGAWSSRSQHHPLLRRPATSIPKKCYENAWEINTITCFEHQKSSYRRHIADKKNPYPIKKKHIEGYITLICASIAIFTSEWSRSNLASKFPKRFIWLICYCQC